MSTGALPVGTTIQVNQSGLVLLGVYTASGGASIDCVTRNVGGSGAIFQADYDTYKFELQGILPGTDATICRMRMSTTGGASYDASAIYGWAYFVNLMTATSNPGEGGNNDVGIQLGGGQLDNDVNYGMNGWLELCNPLSATMFKQLTGAFVFKDNRDAITSIRGQGGIYKSATPVNACQFIQSAGTITGTVLIYGQAKSTTPSAVISQIGRVVQVANFQTGAVGTTTTTIPLDDTIPQNTEGAEFMTCTITPTSAANKLKIEVVTLSSHTTACWLTVALFQDSGVNALATMTQLNSNVATGGGNTILNYMMTAGTISPITFRVRIGGNNAGTLTFNGQAGTRLYGGTANSSITITEILV